jgi:diguanylate cyclase (GGDEF)-like protein
MSYAEIGQIITGATGILLLCFAGYGIANLRFRVPGSRLFVALCLCGALWCVGYVWEKAQTLAEGFEWATRFEYLGIAFLPTLWLLISLHWMNHPLARSKAFRNFVLGFSAATVVLVWTNEFHHLWYESVVPTGIPGFARFQRGPLYYVAFILLTIPFLSTAGLLWERRKATHLFRVKALVILAADLFPFVFAVAFQLGFRPGGLDPTIASLIPSFSVLAWGLFRHDLIRIVPIARETVIESLDEAVLVFDPEGRLVDHNRAAEAALDQFLAGLATQQGTRGTLTIDASGQKLTYRFRRNPVVRSGGPVQGTVVILTDATEELRLVDELAHQASHDALTEVSNRRRFEELALGEITRADRHAGTLALVLFDLDWFKSINDRYGHPAGDTVLRGVVDTVRGRLRPYDHLARIGGEEFAVLLPETRADEAREAAERWRTALEANVVRLPGAAFPVTASFGVATLEDLPLSLPPDPRVRLDALLVLADKALYRAKTGGRNRVC